MLRTPAGCLSSALLLAYFDPFPRSCSPFRPPPPLPLQENVQAALAYCCMMAPLRGTIIHSTVCVVFLVCLSHADPLRELHMVSIF